MKRYFSIIGLGLLVAAAGSLAFSERSSAQMVTAAEFSEFCSSYPAGTSDFMYVVGDSGGVVTVVVTDPAATTVNIRVAMEVNYCHDWGNHEKYLSSGVAAYHGDKRVRSENMVLRDAAGTNRLLDLSSTPQHSYIAFNGSSRRMVTDTYNARLNISGLGEGLHQIRSNFRTNIYNNTIPYTPVIIPSEDYRFTVRIVYDFPWSASGTSTISAPSTAPGQTITWTHRVRNNGPGRTDLAITSNIYRNYTGTTALREVTAAGVAANSNVRQFNATKVIQQSDVGQTLCQRVQWDPVNSSGGRDGRATDACVYIPYNYALKPFISNSLPSVVETGATFTVSPYVERTGPTKSKTAQWNLIQIVTAPGQTSPQAGGGANSGAPCAFHNGVGVVDCDILQSGSQEFIATSTDLPNYDSSVSDLPVGSKMCYGLSVKDRAHNDVKWEHSPLQCVIVGKKPKMQVWGGDVSVRGNINTSTSTKAGTTYGSWGEYGVLSAGTNSGMASGSGLFEGNASSNQNAWSKLTFANVSMPYGLYTTLNPNLPAVADRLITLSANNALPQQINNINTLSGTYSRDGDVEIRGGTLEKGNSVVIKVTGTATITGSLSYTNEPLSSITDIPQLVIIADIINIEDDVTNIDAWLIATGGANGTINTCSNVTGNLTYELCNDPLTVNGPIIANKLILRRTAGSNVGPDSGLPAEVFNLRPDAYLWAQTRASGSGKAQTVMTTELAPRF